MKFDNIVYELNESKKKSGIGKIIAPLMMAIIVFLGGRQIQKIGAEVKAAKEFIKDTPELQAELEKAKIKDENENITSKHLALKYKKEWVKFVDDYVKYKPELSSMKDGLKKAGETDIRSEVFK